MRSGFSLTPQIICCMLIGLPATALAQAGPRIAPFRRIRSNWEPVRFRVPIQPPIGMPLFSFSPAPGMGTLSAITGAPGTSKYTSPSIHRAKLPMMARRTKPGPTRPRARFRSGFRRCGRPCTTRYPPLPMQTPDRFGLWPRLFTARPSRACCWRAPAAACLPLLSEDGTKVRTASIRNPACSRSTRRCPGATRSTTTPMRLEWGAILCLER